MIGLVSYPNIRMNKNQNINFKGMPLSKMVQEFERVYKKTSTSHFEIVDRMMNLVITARNHKIKEEVTAARDAVQGALDFWTNEIKENDVRWVSREDIIAKCKKTIDTLNERLKSMN